MHFVFLVLFIGALVFSIAKWRSEAIGGSEVLNSMRVVRAAGWAMASFVTVEWILTGSSHIHSPMMLVCCLLAFSEVVSGTVRFKQLIVAEKAGLENL